ncbi:MAG TPA: YhfC family glutamic-type intramembrane protease, partial [Methanoregulaceae archaeon]|nr:YhfC family glutamic-type intramembrane protease [Methanoregulaceae archaeon]
GIKLAMDLTITQPIQKALLANLPVVTVVAIMSLYVGLRTGFLESGITYLAVKYTSLSRSGFIEAVALGIGFGGTEAIVLGFLSFVNVLALVMVPGLQAALTPDVLAQFSTAFIPVPVIERLFTLFIHVFSVVLVVYAVRSRELLWLWLSILLKTITDGPLPLFTYYFKPLGTLSFVPIEAYVAALGIISLAGLFWIEKRFKTFPVVPAPE